MADFKRSKVHQKFVDDLLSDDEERGGLGEARDRLIGEADVELMAEEFNGGYEDSRSLLWAGVRLGRQPSREIWEIELGEDLLYFVGNEQEVYRRLKKAKRPEPEEPLESISFRRLTIDEGFHDRPSEAPDLAGSGQKDQGEERKS